MDRSIEKSMRIKKNIKHSNILFKHMDKTTIQQILRQKESLPAHLVQELVQSFLRKMVSLLEEGGN
jgi:hypothetical protein